MKRMKIVQIVNNNFHCSEYIVTVLQPKKLYLKQGYTKYHIPHYDQYFYGKDKQLNSQVKAS